MNAPRVHTGVLGVVRFGSLDNTFCARSILNFREFKCNAHFALVVYRPCRPITDTALN
jgi:hypothetical protein